MTETANKTAVLPVRSVPLVGDEPAMHGQPSSSPEPVPKASS